MKSLFERLLAHVMHVLLILFAVASLGNVYTFFTNVGHPRSVSFILAVAIGSTLVVLSMLLADIDREHDRQAFRWILATALLVGILSGAIQTHVYEAHMPLGWSAVLGFGVPICGEVLLANAVANYHKAKEREKIPSMITNAEIKIVEIVGDAFNSFNSDQIMGAVDDTVNKLTNLGMQRVEDRFLAHYDAGDTVTDNSKANKPKKNKSSSFGKHNLPAASKGRNAAAKAKKNAGKEAILTLLRTEGEKTVTSIATDIGVHRTSAKTYLSELSDAGQVQSQGRKWRLVTS